MKHMELDEKLIYLNTKISYILLLNGFGPQILVYYYVVELIAFVVPIQLREEGAKMDNPSTTYLVI